MPIFLWFPFEGGFLEGDFGSGWVLFKCELMALCAGEQGCGAPATMGGKLVVF